MPLSATVEKSSISYNNRIELIDVLRGFALWGIVISHAAALSKYAGTPALDYGEMVLLILRKNLVVGKFYPIFSFLFGLSFFIQLQRWSTKSKPFAGLFVWRSFILFIIGGIHALFSNGDILHIYAILSLFLLITTRLSNKWLIVISIVLIFFQSYLGKMADNVLAIPQTSTQIRTDGDKGIAAGVHNNTATGVSNAATAGSRPVKMLTGEISNRNFMILGLFLLGVIAGRRNIFFYTDKNLAFFTWMLICSTVVTAVVFLVKLPTEGGGDVPLFFKTLNRIAVACIYVAGITLLYWRTRLKNLLNILGPVGKMGLTNYLMETVFRLGFLYYTGYFIMGRWGWFGGFAYCMLFYMFQVFYSNWWLSRFYYGPMEWLWRSLTYLKWKPIIKTDDKP